MSIQTFTDYVAALPDATAVTTADEEVINQGGVIKVATKALTQPIMRTYLNSYFGMQGRKIDLRLKYVSSDSLSLSTGACEVNDGTDKWWVEKTTATTINSGTTGYPGAGSWVYGTLKPDGTITLRAATGTAAQRPTDNLFALTSGSVGYNDINKHGYYYDVDERVIFAFHKVSATSFYIINLGDGDEEAGENSAGKYMRFQNGYMTQTGQKSETSDITIANENVFRGAEIVAPSYATAFTRLDSYVSQVLTCASRIWFEVGPSDPSTTKGADYYPVMAASTAGVAWTINYTASGKWK